MRQAPCVVLVLLVIAGCGTRTVQQPRVEPPSLERAIEHPSAAEQLRRDLRMIFTSPALDHANWGVNFYSLGKGDTLYSYNAARFLVPASNQKLLTAAVAAERLGWDYRFTTRVLANGPIDQGTLMGDLVIVGNGDPSINPRHATRWQVFDEWALKLQGLGVRAINGRVVGDDDAFEEPGWGRGWEWDDLAFGYGTAVGALQFNENQIVISVAPGSQTEPATVSTMPSTHDLTIDARVLTTAPGTLPAVNVMRIPGSSVLHVRGYIPVDVKPITITVSVRNPTHFYVNALREALERHGITVAGGAVDVDDLPTAISLATATELFADHSPPLSEIIDVCLKWSRNEYAETLLLAVAPPGQPATARAGLEVMRTQLRTWGIFPETYAPVDGSGLSRQDYVTANALTWLLTYLSLDPKHAEPFRSTLPQAGMSGTLAERMKGTPLAGRVWAKTGTLSNVRGLSGYLVTRAGELVAFSMLSNNFQLRTAEIDAAMERALLRVYEYTRSERDESSQQDRH